MTTPPIVWSIAGLDTGGGAGLSADQRMADACGVHLCPVAAALTAQNSVAVERLQAVEPAWLEAQLAALESDLPPAAIKTGLLGSADNVRVIARWIDRLRERDPALPLIVDPVLRASTGATFADGALIAAYREHLLPRANAITPNRAEAQRLVGRDGDPPALARALQAMGATSVCITGGDHHNGVDEAQALDWLATPQASGWLAAERIATVHTHGSGCSFATAFAAAAARGFVDADAAVIAKMAAGAAVRRGRPVGAGPGPVRADAGFIAEAGRLPRLSLGEATIEPHEPHEPPATRFEPGPYAIVDSAAAVERVVQAGARTVQLRIKSFTDAQALRTAIARSLAATRPAGALLVVNDHWALAIELGADAVHLGHDDLLALDAPQRTALAAARAGLKLGLSSHSLWELSRAAALQGDYVACGPVWPTTTKAMPWRSQGLHNLAWWVRMAGMPVVAIGGVLEPAQAAAAARMGAAGMGLVRALGVEPSRTLPHFAAAWRAGCGEVLAPAPAWPAPSLPRESRARPLPP